MMEQPDFDDDDLINDAMEDSFEAPPGYDDEFLEEMMMEQTSDKPKEGTAVATTTIDGAAPAAGTPGLMMEQDDGMEDDDAPAASDDTAAAVPSNIRQVYAQRREAEQNIYSFDRYKHNSDWRSESGNPGSPKNTMRAKEWKKSNTADATTSNNSSRPTNNINALLNSQRPNAAPDSQLLQSLAASHKRVTSIQLPRYSMARTPVVGQKACPMTLGDGTRVYMRVRTADEMKQYAPQRGGSSSSSTNQLDALGTPMAELMRRVQAVRRKQEHDQLQRALLESRQAAERLAAADDDDDGSLENHNTNYNDYDPNAAADEIEDKLWVDKHAPSSFAHLLSDERTNREVVRALRAWDPYVFHRDAPKRPETWFTPNDNSTHANNSNSSNNSNSNSNEADNKAPVAQKASKDRRPEEMARVILLSGPPGVGKTTLAHIVAKHAGYRPLEVNGSDERSSSVLTERVVRAMESTTLNVALMQGGGEGSKAKPNCLILDEIDGADSKAVQALVNIIRADIPAKGAKGKTKTPYLRRPIIFICNNKYAPALRPLLPFAKHFDVFPPSPSRLVARLRSVLSAETMSVFGGSSLLHQLVVSTCGDIRSCLYTLQFSSARAKELAALKRLGAGSDVLRDGSVVDISQSLGSALNGDGMKDQRNDVAGTITTIFRKRKEKKFGDLFGAGKDTRSNTVKILDSVQSFGDNSRLLDCMFLNVLRVSYIDPTFDRCSAAHEWLSSSDVYRSGNHAMERLHIPSAAAAIHFLCRVEQRPDLTYTTRDLSDNRYQREANFALTQKFVEGLSPHARGSRCINLLATETIPYALWVLSAGEGSSSLDRAATSLDILSKGERLSLDQHVATLRSLGLTYVAAHDEAPKEYGVSHAVDIRLEPPIERLVEFNDLSLSTQQKRQAIPPAMKELLAQRAAHDWMRAREKVAAEAKAGTDGQSTAPKGTAQAMPDVTSKRTGQAKDESLPPAKRPKASMTAQNFLVSGAKKAKEARFARNAARVGVQRSQKNKAAHTGSGVPFPQVIRLKYVKGFTQAVRTPCRLEDL